MLPINTTAITVKIRVIPHRTIQRGGVPSISVIWSDFMLIFSFPINGTRITQIKLIDTNLLQEHKVSDYMNAH